jgi:acyl carrier protein
MPVRDRVIAEFVQVASEQKRHLAPLRDDLRLVDSGLDSLCFAIIVARLEDEFGTDPFESRAATGSPFPVTFGDFLRFYENVRK